MRKKPFGHLHAHEVAEGVTTDTDEGTFEVRTTTLDAETVAEQLAFLASRFNV